MPHLIRFGLLLVFAGSVFATPSSRALTAPEIDAGSAASALTLVSASVLMLRGRKK
jgi:hypothetical protein